MSLLSILLLLSDILIFVNAEGLMAIHFLAKFLISVNAVICSICEFPIILTICYYSKMILLIYGTFLGSSHLENNQLTGDLPPSLGDLPNLKEL